MGNILGFFAAIPLDYFLLGGIIIASALDSLRSGVGRTAALSIALPLSVFLHSFLAHAALVGSMGSISTGVMGAAVYGVLVILSYLMVRRMGLDFIDGGRGEPIQAMLAGLALAVIFTVVWLATPSLNSFWQFGAQIQSVFDESFRFWLLLSAYAALAFARG